MSSQDDRSSRRENLSPTQRALLEQRLRGLKGGAQPAAAVAPKPPAAPDWLSFAQERMVFAAQLNPRSPAYNMHAAFRLHGPLDPAALETALNHLVARHDVLRTCFQAAEGSIRPVVYASLHLDIPLVDLSALPEAGQQASLARLGLNEARHLFDLARLPLLRLTLARLKPNDHVIFLALHHIIADEWSIRLFWEELTALYAAAAAGRAPALPPPQLQYADFTHWQRERLSSGALDGQRGYWLKRLAPPRARLQLPLDYPRPPVQEHNGAIATLRLPPEVRGALDGLNQQAGTTPFMALLAVYALLLQRYSGQDDLFIGMPMTNRGQKEFESLLGVCLNTLVLRLDLGGDPSFRELLGRVRAEALNAFANSEMPFEKLVEELNPIRDLSHNPLFQAMFVYQSQPDEARLLGLRAEPYPVDGGVSKFDLTLFAGEGSGGYDIFLEYNTDLLLPATARRLLDGFAALAEAAARRPETPISRLPLLDEAERRRLLPTCPPAPTPAYATIHAMFEEWAARAPEAPALRERERSLTYAGLNRRADRLARALQAAGVGPNVVVGLCAERSLELFVGMLAILKAGGAYLPLDPKYPLERRAFMLEDAGAWLVVTQPQLAGLFEETGQAVLLLHPVDGDAEEHLDSAGLLATSSAGPHDLAYLIYTSGSTGRPKGVPVTHANLLHSTAARLRCYPEKARRFLLLSSFAFDSSVAGIFGTLCGGGTLCLPAPGQEQDVVAMAEMIERWQVTQMLCLPALYGLLLEYADPRSLASLKTVIVAGEACPPGLVRQHHASLAGTGLFNEYGPTEGTVWCSVYNVPPELPWRSVPIGQAIETARIYILDSHLEPVPAGMQGELYLAGAGLVNGYWNRPDLTQERFIQHDWPETGPVRLYRTGDLARWLPDGNIEFLGRVDQQVKVRGHRIELEEIEQALLEQPGISQAVVLIHEDPAPALDPGDLEAVAAALIAAGDQGLRLLEAIERSPSAFTEVNQP